MLKTSAQRILILYSLMDTIAQDTEFDSDFPSLTDFSDLVDSIFPVEKNSVSKGEKYVVFRLDEKLYAVHFRQVVEVVDLPFVTSLPLAPRWLAGIANLRGAIIPVVDLRKLWKKTTSPTPKSKLLILRSSKDSSIAGFIVDKSNEMVILNAREIEFSAADFESSFPTFFGRTQHNSQTLYLLDAENLFSSLSVSDN